MNVPKNRRRLRICYFLPCLSPHSQRLLDYFSERGHELYVFSEDKGGFFRWKVRDSAKSGEDRTLFKRKMFLRRLKRVRFVRSIASFAISAHDLFKGFGNRYYKILPQGVKCVFLKVYFPWRRIQIKDRISDICPDIVHVLYLAQNAVDAYISGFQPSVLTAWGSDIRNRDSLSTNYQHALRKKALLRASAITAPTEDLLSACGKNNNGQARFHLIGMPGIDISNFENTSSDESDRLYD